MYKDKIEIINPRALYGTNRIGKLGTATTIESRNPTLVRILEEKGSVIENRHSRIPTMIREMKRYGLPFPKFYEERDSFKVILEIILLMKQHNNQHKIIIMKNLKIKDIWKSLKNLLIKIMDI